MGRGNVCVTGSYEGLFYIDNDDLQVWRKDGPDGKEPEIRMMADISLDELVADDWYVDEIESSYELDRTTLNSLAPRAAVLMRKYIDNDDSWTYHRDYAISEAVSEYKEDKDNG